jgi:hypothetical protein
MLIGQIQISLAGRETVPRRLNWDGYSEKSRRQIQGAVFDQLDLFLGPLVPVPCLRLARSGRWISELDLG